MQKQSTQNPSIAATGQSLVTVQMRHGKPMVSSLTIAEVFGRRHDRVIARARELGLPVFWESYVNAQGKDQPMFWAAEREALIMMPFLGGRQSMEGQTRLVDAYLAYHRQAESRKEPEWQLIRDETKVGFKWMNETLQEARAAIGKETKAHHFSNEARMINAVLAGKACKLDRNSLSASDLALMADLQRLNAVLIGQNMPYKERKAVLMDRSTKKLAA